MKSFFGYIRVSTPKQGRGVSLQEQRSAIEDFAARQNARIIDWFEEQETAAKRGRPVFDRMLKALRAHKADGVVVHKIDRSARNLKDWADLGELIDSGTELHFATDNLDLASRGGRLSADIQAVVAADYIRNLREETRKGLYGRLKQGLYPLHAPLGYLDTGGGNPKAIDPILGPFVRRAFELYATGLYSLETLRQQLFAEGLRRRDTQPLSRARLSAILNNPFYVGVIRLRGNKGTYLGIHPPLVSMQLFDAVQRALNGKVAPKVRTHHFLFRRLMRCVGCGRSLIGETRKSHVYYRCHTRSCIRVCVREEHVWKAVGLAYAGATDFNEEELDQIEQALATMHGVDLASNEDRERALQLKTAQLKNRLDVLTDALVDGLIDKDTYTSRRSSLLLESQRVADGLVAANNPVSAIRDDAEKKLGLLKTLSLTLKSASDAEKREMLARTTSDLCVSGKNVVVELCSPFREIKNRGTVCSSGPARAVTRTFASTANPSREARRVAAIIYASAKVAAAEAEKQAA